MIVTPRQKTKMPKVSVLLPVFNAERFISEAVESILVQTFADFELILIDDGSTDHSGTILEQFARRDSRVVLRRRENRGLVATLNEMIALAQGEYFARMDADDVADCMRFEKEIAVLDSDAGLAAVGSDVYSIDPKGRRLTHWRQPRNHEEIIAFTMAVKGGSAMCHPTMLIRRCAMEAVGGYRAEYWPAEDADLILRLGEIGRLTNIAEPLLCYRVHAGSIGHTVPLKQRRAHHRAVSDAAARQGLPAPDSSLDKMAPEEWGDGLHEVKWAWWAIRSGYVESARSLAIEAVRRYPLSKQSWKVLACAIRGH